MNTSFKITALVVLVAFAGLLGLGLLSYSSTNYQSAHMECFGAECGPVEHVVMHTYTLTSLVNTTGNIHTFWEINIVKKLTFQSAEYITDSPPPKISLS